MTQNTNRCFEEIILRTLHMADILKKKQLLTLFGEEGMEKSNFSTHSIKLRHPIIGCKMNRDY